MSDTPQGADWWQASDGNWYPPEARPSASKPLPPPDAPPLVAPAVTEADAPGVTDSRRPWWRKWWVIAIAVLVVLGIIGAVAGGGGKDDDAKEDRNESLGRITSPTEAESVQPGTTSAETAPSDVADPTVATVEATITTLPPTTETPTTTLPPTTTVPESGISLGAPAPVGEAVQVGDWAIRVVGVTPDAAGAIAAENDFNDPPAEGKRFFMATLEATYTGTDSSTFWVDMALKAIGASNVAYEGGFDTSCGVIPNDISNAGEAFPGGTIIGNACWAVDESDAASPTMIAEPSLSFDNDARRFLSMDPTATPVEDSTTIGAPTPQRIPGASIGEALQVGDWTIKVVSVTPDAGAEIAATNQFNDPPVDGNQFYMATLEATYTGTETSTFWVDMTLKAIGASSVAYEGFEASCGVIPNDITDAGETFPGGTISGNVCWSIRSGDATSLTMLVEPSLSFESDSRVAFSLV